MGSTVEYLKQFRRAQDFSARAGTGITDDIVTGSMVPGRGPRCRRATEAISA
jgi:hypothetical protein